MSADYINGSLENIVMETESQNKTKNDNKQKKILPFFFFANNTQTRILLENDVKQFTHTRGTTKSYIIHCICFQDS
jgi:RAB protein geranylgeranyltransferase component A